MNAFSEPYAQASATDKVFGTHRIKVNARLAPRREGLGGLGATIESDPTRRMPGVR
jgi:hypothetical protein